MSPQLGIAVVIIALALAAFAVAAIVPRVRRIRSAARRKAALDDVARYTRATSGPYSPDPLDVRWRDDPDRDRPLTGDVPPPPRRWYARRPRRAWPS